MNASKQPASKPSPRRRRPMSLQARLTLSFLIIIVVTSGVIVLLADRITTERFTHMISVRGQARAKILAPVFARYYEQANSWEGVEVLFDGGVETFAGGRGPRAGPMMGNGMSQGASTTPHGPTAGMMMDSYDERIVLLDTDGHLIADSHPDDKPMRLSPEAHQKGTAIFVNQNHVGTLIIASAIGDLTGDQQAFLRQVNQLVLATAALAGLAVLVVSHIEARRLTAPVRALAEAARRVAKGDFSRRVAEEGSTELAEMAASFNAMATKLDEQQALRHRAMADIAHELRTPLSVLQIDLESLEDGLVEPTPDVIAGLQMEVTHLKHLVEDLRTLSLAEAGELPVTLQQIDAGELARNAVSRIQSAAREQEIALEEDIPGSAIFVNGDSQRLAQVLLNLLSNALRHTPPGGTITVGVAREGPEAHIRVQDTGPGIDPADLPHIFERFYRADKARTREAGGSGLGLAIVRSLVEAHGGRVWAESREGQGSRFYVALPLCKNSF